MALDEVDTESGDRAVRGRPSPDWRDRFVEVLAECANVAASCRAAGVSRTTAYAEREANEDFKRGWDEAKESAFDDLEQEAWRRARHGDKHTTYNKSGDVVAERTEYSDTLTMFLLKGGRPDKFRERPVLVNSGISVEALAQELLKARSGVQATIGSAPPKETTDAGAG